MSELKPCPFCGGEAELRHIAHGKTAYVVCTKCGCKTQNTPAKCEYSADDIVATAWNRRAV